MKKYIKSKLGLFSIAIVAMFVFVAASKGDKFFEIARNLDTFATIYKELNAYYVDDINPNKLMKDGIDEMLATLDPYTNYIPEDNIEDYRTMTTGQYDGIGCIIGIQNKRPTVLMLYQNAPAVQAGLKIADELVSVDGIVVSDKQVDEISKLLKGQGGTSVKVKVKRQGSSSEIELTITRKHITIDNVPYYGFVEPQIGYIQLTEFTNNAAKDVSFSLSDLKKQGATSVILDLRGNPGGLLNEAVDLSNLFIPRGKNVVSTKGKITDWNKTYTALNSPIDTEIPIAVLINGRSASASEIVSGVIQDYDRGVLVGQKSFGKGLVQSTRPLPYNSQLKLTVAKYYTPSGRCIQAIDYSHRAEDGTVSKFADSTHKAFKTQGNRTVYDGGGVTPDVVVTKPEYPAILLSIAENGFLFDWVTTYVVGKQSIAPAKEFHLSDKEYDEFVKWISTKDYEYKSNLEKELDKLVETAKSDKSYDLVKEQVDALRSKVAKNKDKELYLYKNEIKQELEENIISRFYLQKGVIESSFDDDLDIREAVKVLKDRARYQAILKGVK